MAFRMLLRLKECNEWVCPILSMNKLITILDRTQERSAIDSKDSLLNVLEIYKAC